MIWESMGFSPVYTACGDSTVMRLDNPAESSGGNAARAVAMGGMVSTPNWARTRDCRSWFCLSSESTRRFSALINESVSRAKSAGVLIKSLRVPMKRKRQNTHKVKKAAETRAALPAAIPAAVTSADDSVF